MLWLPPSVPIFLATEPVDMRKGIDGLFGAVRDHFGVDPFSGALFVFLGRCRSRVKVLVWDAGGFVLVLKRLEKGSIPPADGAARLHRGDAEQHGAGDAALGDRPAAGGPAGPVEPEGIV